MNSDLSWQSNIHPKHNKGLESSISILILYPALYIFMLTGVAFGAGDLNLTLPPKIYCNPITPVSLYYENVILNLELDSFTFAVSPAVGIDDSVKYSFQPLLLSPGATVMDVTVYDSVGALVASASTDIEFVEGDVTPTDTINILIIGNSLTAEGTYIAHLNSLLVDTLNYPVRFLGTNW